MGSTDKAAPAAADPSGTARIEQRLDVIVHLLGAIVTKDMTRKDAVLKLSATGLPPKDLVAHRRRRSGCVDAAGTRSRGHPSLAGVA